MEELRIQEIKCEALLDTKKVVERIEQKIDSTRDIKERKLYFQDILSELNVLSTCSKYNAESNDCLGCRNLSAVKKDNISSLLKSMKQPLRLYYGGVR